MAPGYVGKDRDLACRKFGGLGHICGNPVSRGCSGLASEMITKAPLGQLLYQWPQGPFLLLRGLSPAHRSAVSPEHLQEFRRNGAQVFQRNGQTCRHHSPRACGVRPQAAVPCEWSRLVRRSSLVAFGGGIDRLRLVFKRVVTGSRLQSGILDLVVVPMDIPRVECHVTRH